MCPHSEHRSHKGLNNRVENSHQPTRRKEKGLIKFKSAKGVQVLLSLMGRVRNIFAIGVNRYKQSAQDRRKAFKGSSRNMVRCGVTASLYLKTGKRTINTP